MEFPDSYRYGWSCSATEPMPRKTRQRVSRATLWEIWWHLPIGYSHLREDSPLITLPIRPLISLSYPLSLLTLPNTNNILPCILQPVLFPRGVVLSASATLSHLHYTFNLPPLARWPSWTERFSFPGRFWLKLGLILMFDVSIKHLGQRWGPNSKLSKLQLGVEVGKCRVGAIMLL